MSQVLKNKTDGVGNIKIQQEWNDYEQYNCNIY